MTQLVRHITVIGNSLGVTLPKDLAAVYGLEKGALVTVRPMDNGLLLEPVKVTSAMSPKGRALTQNIIRRYRGALDALARENRRPR